MPLASMREILPLLDEHEICLPAIDIAGGHPDFVLGTLKAFEETQCPALMIVYQPAATYVGFEACAEIVKYYAGKSPIPVMLHLDHMNREEMIAKAIDVGFTSVMFDASAEPMDENIRRTKVMVEYAHSRGVMLEGELGNIGAEETGEGGVGLTNPNEAEIYVAETGVDIFAPAVGNVHGIYTDPPNLRFGLIQEIHERTGVPLSLHGGTGIPLEDVCRAGGLGMRKMNVATQIHKTYGEALMSGEITNTDRQYNWRGMQLAGRDAIQEKVAWYIRGCGAEGLLT